MALKSIIYKATLQIADMDRHYYADHQLSIACHPSETLQRMMIRVLVFALHANERLEFGKGISDAEEPDIWQKDLTGTIEQWIEIGQPEERRILKASGRSDKVFLYLYGSGASVWWKQIHSKLARARNLTVVQIAPEIAIDLERFCHRTMHLQATIQDGEIWIRDEEHAVEIKMETLQTALN